MSRSLRRGDTGEDVRQLQVNLIRMLRGRVHIIPNGIFGPQTEQAVTMIERQLHLHQDRGSAGPEVQYALSIRIIEVTGTISRNVSGPAPALPRTSHVPSSPAPIPQTAPGGWLVQGQLGPMSTPPPFNFYDPMNGPAPGNFLSGGIAIGLLYRTASTGRHWEFNLGPGFAINTFNSSTDPRYTLQLQTAITLADPFARGSFHTALFGQLAGLINMVPTTTGALQAALGGQISVDIVENVLSVILQGTLATQWNLSNGQVQFGLGFVAGPTIQWELGAHHLK